MRWSVPGLLTPRGAGLGNEVIPWAKAYLGARELGLTLVSPPWRLNARRYDRELGGGLWNAAGYEIVRYGPRLEIDTSAVLESGEADYVDVVQRLAPNLRRRRAPAVVHTSGMHGGYLAIRQARSFLRAKLLAAPSAVAAAAAVERPEEPIVRIGVHYRSGDFPDAAPSPGTFNGRVPLSWYVEVIQSLAAALGVPTEVVLATDSGDDGELAAFSINHKAPRRVAQTSVGDLAALVHSDILVASVSSFSMLAAFLSDAPYVWYAPHLTSVGGWRSLWGGEELAAGGGRTRRAIDVVAHLSQDARFGRGVPQGETPVWSERLIRYVTARAFSRRLEADLIYYGVVGRASDAT